MRILFQGDSVTDAGRSYADVSSLGNGYVRYAAELLREEYGQDTVIINRGISGEKTVDLLKRWDDDCVGLKPDVVSILIGVNDSWHSLDAGFVMPDEEFRANYRALCERIKVETSAKLIIMDQFLLPVPEFAYIRSDLSAKINITRETAREYADAYVPLDGLFAAECVGTDMETIRSLAGDGIHPCEKGAKFIASHYIQAVKRVMS